MVKLQNLPASGLARETLREKGQFWTPAWLAQAMVAYVTATGSNSVFDPAVGAGAFFQAAKVLSKEVKRSLTLLGTEIDPQALDQARHNGLDNSDLAQVQLTNFVLQPPSGLYEAIVANPPYIRHHRLATSDKVILKEFAQRLTGINLDGRAGLHVYFLLRALQLLAPGGRLAFIMPADVCEGVFAYSLWQWITTHFKLDAVITFDPTASPFPKVDTNPVIFLIRHSSSRNNFLWTKCTSSQVINLKAWLQSSCNPTLAGELTLHSRTIAEGLATGLSRPPQEKLENGLTLANFATVMRGIATGANDFFFLTSQQVHDLGIPDEFVVTAVGRTRDVPGAEITDLTIKELQKKGRPTCLLALDGRPLEEFPQALRNYLKHGETLGINRGELIKQRKPWYKMEVRNAPPIFFAYLGRRKVRFIYNRAAALPLTSFLCVYPHSTDTKSVENLLKVLSHPKTVANLALVGKSYGDGAIKVEPRALERLLLPMSVITEVGLEQSNSKQGRFRKLPSNNEESKQLNMFTNSMNVFTTPD